MDLIGDIVEREPVAPIPPSVTKPVQSTGFPKLPASKESRWRQKRNLKPNARLVQPLPVTTKNLSESEKIHQENLDKIKGMTEGEIQAERDELLNSLDPKLVQSLLKRIEKRQDHDHDHADGHEDENNGWIGGDREGKLSLPSLDEKDVDLALGIKTLTTGPVPKVYEPELKPFKLEERRAASLENVKKVRFDELASVAYEDVADRVDIESDGWEDVENVNEMVPGEEQIADDDYQLVQEREREAGVHFSKPREHELDLDDPEFYDKLHEKYYPDLPKETSKLSWMTTPVPTTVPTEYESIADLRFDFKGNIVKLDEKSVEEVKTYIGLHHHAENPQLAGYTLPELAHLSRSVVPSQRCIAIQVLGRILHKLGLHRYDVAPAAVEDEDEEEQEEAGFEPLMWDIIEQLRIIETLTEASDEKLTRNLSVRSYAIEALWLWNKGKDEKKDKKDKKDAKGEDLK